MYVLGVLHLEGVTHNLGSQLCHSTEGWGWVDVCVCVWSPFLGDKWWWPWDGKGIHGHKDVLWCQGGLGGAGGVCPPPALPSPDPAPQSLLYKKVNEAQYRSHLANEMMMYHMKVRYHEDRDRDGDPHCQHGAPTLYPKVVTQLGGGDTPGLSALPMVPVALGHLVTWPQSGSLAVAPAGV